MDQIRNLHVKLDKILRLLEPKTETPAITKEEVSVVLEPKPEKVKAPKKKVKKEKVEIEKSLAN